MKLQKKKVSPSFEETQKLPGKENDEKKVIGKTNKA